MIKKKSWQVVLFHLTGYKMVSFENHEILNENVGM